MLKSSALNTFCKKNPKLILSLQVLYAVMKGTNGSDIEGLSLPVDEDFDPNIQSDNLGPKTSPASTIDVKLWAQTVTICR